MTFFELLQDHHCPGSSRFHLVRRPASLSSGLERSQTRQLDVVVADLLALLRDLVGSDDRPRDEVGRQVRTRVSRQG